MDDPKAISKPSERSSPTTVNFDYVKANDFRVVHADGAFGGVTPSGDSLAISFYSERFAIPLRVTHELQETGALGKEIKRQNRDAIVREVETMVVIDLNVALVLQKWLDDKIEELKRAMTAVADMRKKVQEGQGNKSS